MPKFSESGKHIFSRFPFSFLEVSGEFREARVSVNSYTKFGMCRQEVKSRKAELCFSFPVFFLEVLGLGGSACTCGSPPKVKHVQQPK